MRFDSAVIMLTVCVHESSDPSPPCRTNIAYQRYWEARGMLEEFDSKLTDVLVHSLALDRSNKAAALQSTPKEAQNLEVEHQRFKNVTTHLLSLMHAVAFCTLRDDFDLYNLTVRSLLDCGCSVFHESLSPVCSDLFQTQALTNGSSLVQIPSLCGTKLCSIRPLLVFAATWLQIDPPVGWISRSSHHIDPYLWSHPLHGTS